MQSVLLQWFWNWGSGATKFQHLARERILEGQYVRYMGCWPSEQGCRRTPTGRLASHPEKGCYSQAGRLGSQGLWPQHQRAGCWGPRGRRRRPGGSAWSGEPPRWTAGAGCTGRLGRAGLDTSPAQPRMASAHRPGDRDQTRARQRANRTRIRCELTRWPENHRAKMEFNNCHWHWGRG